ncbi:hypothetical protein PO124_04300 [Bacillus licheniformis]|nr:hypothetical protein [Bacillus licheniformis]
MKQSTLEMFLERLLGNDIREEFAELVEEALRANDEFSVCLRKCRKAEGSERMRIKDDTDVKKRPPSCMICLKNRRGARFEGELYTIDQYALTVVEEYLEQMAYSLSLYRKMRSAGLNKRA